MTFQDWITVIQTMILLGGFGIGLYTLHRQKAESKAMATLNMIMHQREDDDLREVSNAIRKQDNAQLFFKDEAHRHDVLKVLNLRETVAIAINQGILDENTYKQIFYSLVLQDWNDLKAVIYAIRKEQKSETLFQDFENLVIRWQAHPLTKKI